MEPDCGDCQVAEWDLDTKALFVIYARVCPWGELDYTVFKDAFNDLEIPNFKRAMMRRNLVAIHREIKKYQVSEHTRLRAENQKPNTENR
ncbi:hypothetical protein JYU00_01410 [bacterium AH-315-N22]|nr:hypothetical protein [bacterium AH-315-N22]